VTTAGWRFAAALVLTLLPLIVRAAPGPAAEAVYIPADECQQCHKPQARTYLGGRHGRIFSFAPRDQREARACQACHGPGSNHLQVAGELDYDGPLFIRNFRTTPADEINRTCLGCHENRERLHWRGSAHAMEGFACTNCHRIHSESPVPTMEVCIGCHKTERAKLERSNHMPLPEGKVSCMNCHNPHGGVGPSSLRQGSVNETCYQCHAEKRGPFLFEHVPVQDDCTNCHDPHGSNNVKLLKKKPPYLCQQCHIEAFHPGDLYEGSDLRNPAIRQLRAKACLNCHSRIHGSNHPSGARFQR
jgi:DmsE family decaheme c-type cytochrome